MTDGKILSASAVCYRVFSDGVFFRNRTGYSGVFII